MTTMTTVFGMMPMALGLGEGSEFYRGMAITVIFGLSFSTILTLVLIPVLYSVVDDFTTKLITKIKNISNKSKKKGVNNGSKRNVKLYSFNIDVCCFLFFRNKTTKEKSK